MTDMTKDPVTTLADYLTSSTRVVNHSVALQIGGAAKQEADAFFALRTALGVTGYMTSDDAEKAIAKTYGLTPS